MNRTTVSVRGDYLAWYEHVPGSTAYLSCRVPGRAYDEEVPFLMTWDAPPPPTRPPTVHTTDRTPKQDPFFELVPNYTPTLVVSLLVSTVILIMVGVLLFVALDKKHQISKAMKVDDSEMKLMT